MLILGIESATRVASVGLVRAAHDAGGPPVSEPGRVTDACVALAEVSRDTGRAHGAELLSLMDECLSAGGHGLEEIDCIAVSSGPGSFTGLRVALATAKGLALAGDIALVGVPTLEALAATLVPGWGNDAAPAAAEGALIAACVDARKGEVYTALFAVRAPIWREPNPRLQRLAADAAQSPAEFAAELLEALDAERHLILLGDGPERYREILEPRDERARVYPFDRVPPQGVTVARLGAGLMAAGGGQDRAALVPQYARASEAELVRARRASEPPRPH